MLVHQYNASKFTEAVNILVTSINMFLVSLLNISVTYLVDLCSKNILFEIMYRNLQRWSYSKYATSICPNEYRPVIKSHHCKCCCHWSNITGTQRISCKWRRKNSDCEYVWSKLWYRIIQLYWVIYFELKGQDLYLVGYTKLASWVI